jgi:hypothetical protein
VSTNLSSTPAPGIHEHPHCEDEIQPNKLKQPKHTPCRKENNKFTIGFNLRNEPREGK